MKYGIVVAARQESSRLPLKHLYPLYGKKTLFNVLFERLELTGLERILALPANNRIYSDWGEALGVKVCSPSSVSPQDVTSRLWSATQQFDLENIIFVYGDSPLTCPRLIEQLIDIYESERWDLVWNEGPSGFRVKITSRDCLWKWVSQVSGEPEHPLRGLTNPFPLKMRMIEASTSKHKFSIDRLNDLYFVRNLVEGVGIDGILSDYVEAANTLSSSTNN